MIDNTHSNNLSRLFHNLRDSSVELALALYVCYEAICLVFGWLTTLYINRNLAVQAEYLCYAVICVLLLISFRRLLQSIRTDFVLLFLWFFVIYGIAILDRDKLAIIRSNRLIFHTFIEGLSLYLLVRSVRDYDSLLKYLSILCFVSLVVDCLAFLNINVGSTDKYRTFSGGMVYVCTILVVNVAYLKKTSQLPFLAISLVMMIIGGRRSSIISIAIVYMAICAIERDYKKIALTLVVCAIFFFASDYIIDVLFDVSKKLGLRTRTLNKITRGEFGDDSIRLAKWKYLLKSVFASVPAFLFGFGIVGDRKLLFEGFIRDLDTLKAGYPHNIIVEFIAQFGFILGSLFSIYCVWWGPKCYCERNSSDSSRMAVFLIALALASQLLLQDSYLNNKYFFFYLGLIIPAAAIKLRSEMIGSR